MTLFIYDTSQNFFHDNRSKLKFHLLTYISYYHSWCYPKKNHFFFHPNFLGYCVSVFEGYLSGLFTRTLYSHKHIHIKAYLIFMFFLHQGYELIFFTWLLCCPSKYASMCFFFNIQATECL